MNKKAILMASIILLAILAIGAVSAQDTQTMAGAAGDDISSAGDISTLTDDGDEDTDPDEGDDYENYTDPDEGDEFDDDDTDPDDDWEDDDDTTTGNETLDFEIITSDDIRLFQETGINITNLPEDIDPDMYFEISIDDYDDYIFSYDSEIIYHTTFEEMGEHTITVSYPGDYKYAPITKTIHINITKYSIAPLDTDYPYHRSNWIRLYAPEDFDATVTVTFNGKTYKVNRDEEGEYYVKISDLKLGENLINIYYEGDDEFEEVNDTYIINGVPAIAISNDYDIHYNDDTLIYLYLPEDGTGKLNIYRTEYDYDSDETVKTLLISQAMKDGYAGVEISKIAFGYLELYAEFEGNYEVSPNDFDLSIRPAITIPSHVIRGKELNIIYDVPDNVDVNFTVYERFTDEDTDDYADTPLRHVEGKGKTSIAIALSNEDSHRIVIKDCDDEEIASQRVYVINSTDVELKFEDPISEKIVPDRYRSYFSIDLPPYAEGIISVYVDGKLVEKEEFNYYENYFYIKTEDLEMGNHTLEVRFESDVFKNQTITDTFEITDVNIYIPEKIIADDHEAPEAGFIRVYLIEGATGYVETYVDGELLSNKTVGEYAYASQDLRGLSIGEHTVKVIYSGDDKINRRTQTATTVVDYRMYISALDITYGEEANFYLVIPEDISSGDILFSLNGVSYPVNTTEYGYEVKIRGLEIGNYTAVLTYTGDKKYPAKSINETFLVVAGITESHSTYYWGDDGDTISLNLPSNAKGSLLLNITDRTNKKTFDPIEIPLVNGKASYNITQLGIGRFLISYAYTGSDYPIKADKYDLDINPNIEFSTYGKTTPLNNDTISIYAPDIPNSILNILIANRDNYEFDEFDEMIEVPITVVDENITLVNGRASYSLNGLKLGNYYVTTSYIVDGKVIYESYEISLEMTPKIEGDAEIDFIKPANITVDMPAGESGDVTLVIYDEEYNEIERISGELTDGTATIEIPELSIGEYNFNVIYEGDSGKSNIWIYDVQIEANVTIPNEFNYAGPTAITYAIGKLKGNFSLYIDEKLVLTVPASESKGSIEIPEEYTSKDRYIELIFEGDDGTSFKNSEYIYAAYRTDPNMDVKVNTPIVGSDLTFTVNLAKRATGKVFVTIGGKTYEANISSGIATLSISGLAVGTYNATVTYEGDKDFNTSSKDMTAIVTASERKKPEITIEAEDKIREETPLTVTVKVTGATGSVTINGKDIPLENSVATTTLENLKLGENTITVIYSGDVKYSNATKTKNITVTAKSDAGLNVSVSNITVGEDGKLNIEINPDATGNVTVNGKTVTIKDGKATCTISKPDAGIHSVEVKYSGDANYKAATQSVTFKVSKITPIITISALEEIREGENLTVTAIIIGATGSVTINGANITLENGIASTTFTDLIEGEAVFTVVYSGDDKFMEGTQSKTVRIIGQHDVNLKAIAFNVSAGEDAYISISIDPSATGNVTVDSQKVTMTNGSGTFKISQPKAGTHTVTVRFEGDAVFNNTETTVTFSVSKMTAPITVLNPESTTPTFTVTLPTDATGTVTVTVNGKTATADVANGTAVAKITGLSVGTYNAVVTYSGNDKYFEFTLEFNTTVLTTPKISAANKAFYYNAGSKYSVKVYDKYGKLASGVYVVFKVNGKQVAKVKTNSNGVAGFKVTQLPKTYKVSATALGKTVTKKLTVKRVLALKAVSVKRSAKQLVLQATLKKGKTPIKGKAVTFKFNGKKVKTVKTNNRGIAKVTVSAKVLKTLKVNKKVAYQATYAKDTVKRTAKVKK